MGQTIWPSVGFRLLEEVKFRKVSFSRVWNILLVVISPNNLPQLSTVFVVSHVFFSGNPNYEGSKAKWLPWRYIPSEHLNSEEMDMENVLYSHPNEYHFMTDFDLSNEEEDI